MGLSNMVVVDCSGYCTYIEDRGLPLYNFFIMLVDKLLQLARPRYVLFVFSGRGNDHGYLYQILYAAGFPVYLSGRKDPYLIPSLCVTLRQSIQFILITNNQNWADFLEGISCYDILSGKKLKADIKTGIPLFNTKAIKRFENANLSDFVIKPARKLDLLHLLETHNIHSWLSKLILSLSVHEKIEQAQRRGYRVITTQLEWNAWLATLNQNKLFALDTETTGLDYLTSEIVGISMAIGKGEAVYIPFLHQDPECVEQLNREVVLNQLKPLLENPNYLKIGHNIKFDMNVLKHHGITLNGVAYDTMIEAYVCDTTLPYYNLSYLANNLLARATIEYEDIAGKGKQQIPFNLVPLALAGPYSAEDADLTWLLHQKIYPTITSNFGLNYIFNEIEMPLVSILSEMEYHGVLVDKAQLLSLGEELKDQIDQYIQQIYELAGEEFNLNSTKQLQLILYDKLKLPVYRKTSNGQASTAEDILAKLSNDYPIAKLMMSYRELSKLKSTFIDALIAKIHPKSGRIHTSFNQTITLTGRLSSSNPNLQNIPIQSDKGKRIRKAFIAPKGCQLIIADYSQIELRIMAQLSQDPNLIQAFKADLDIHKSTASEIFNTPLDQVTERQRNRAKVVNFGLIYGMSVYGLSQQLSISHSEARRYIDTYFSRYPAVLSYIEQTKEKAREQGFVTTYFGRKIYISDLDDHNDKKKQAAERIAVNAPIQGTAADIIKLAMIKVTQRFKQQCQQTSLILQVHDELVFETPTDNSSVVQELIKSDMMSVANFDIPLTLDIELSSSWYS